MLQWILNSRQNRTGRQNWKRKWLWTRKECQPRLRPTVNLPSPLWASAPLDLPRPHHAKTRCVWGPPGGETGGQPTCCRLGRSAGVAHSWPQSQPLSPAMGLAGLALFHFTCPLPLMLKWHTVTGHLLGPFSFPQIQNTHSSLSYFTSYKWPLMPALREPVPAATMRVPRSSWRGAARQCPPASPARLPRKSSRLPSVQSLPPFSGLHHTHSNYKSSPGFASPSLRGDSCVLMGGIQASVFTKTLGTNVCRNYTYKVRSFTPRVTHKCRC